MPDKAEASECCILCGQELRGVPQDPYAATAMAFLLIEQQKVAIKQAIADAKIAAAVRWCEEHDASLNRASGKWWVHAGSGMDFRAVNAPDLPSAVAALRKRVEGKQ